VTPAGQAQVGTRASWSGLGPELEQLAFRIGIKPALRVLVPAHRLATLELSGAAWVCAAYDAETAVCYVARDRGWAEALRGCEAPVLPSAPRRAPDAEVLAAHRELGRLLGYPRCCVETYASRLGRGVDVRRDGSRAAELVVAAEGALAASAEVLGRLNVFLLRPLIPFAPCRFDCELALRYADALFEALGERRPDEARALAERAIQPVHVDSRGARLDPRDPDAEPALALRFDRF
jgi:hypothetical protein